MTSSFSVVVPTLNESARISETLAAARRALGENAQLIVSDGGSRDDTTAKAGAAGATIIEGAANRGTQLDSGFRNASGTVCVFLHADTLLPPNAGAAIDRALTDADVVGGAFRLNFASGGPPTRFLAFLQAAINVRSRLFSTATGDQAIFARREVLQRVGGVPQVPLFEDVRLCRRLRRAGKFVVLSEAVTTSPRLWQERGSYRTVALHLGFRLLHTLGVSPFVLRRFYPVARGADQF